MSSTLKPPSAGPAASFFENLSPQFLEMGAQLLSVGNTIKELNELTFSDFKLPAISLPNISSFVFQDWDGLKQASLEVSKVLEFVRPFDDLALLDWTKTITPQPTPYPDTLDEENTFFPRNNSPKPSGLAEVDSELVNYRDMEPFLRDYKFDLSLYHYQEAIDAYQLGIFAASNSQIRTFLESFIIELCSYATGTEKDNPYGAIDHLLNQSFLTKKVAILVRSILSINNTNGAHPGYTNFDQSRSRLLMVTGIVFYLMELLERRKKLN